jgi:hypothetical protein
VRGVADELAQPVLARLSLGERLLQPVQHAVERDPHAADLGAPVGHLDAVGEVAAGDPARGVADAVERQQAVAHDHPGDRGEHEQDADDHEALDEHEPVERLVGVVERDGDDRHPAVLEGAGDHAVAVVVAALAGDGLRLPDGELLRDLRRGVDVLAVVEDDRVGLAAGAQLPVGAGREADTGATGSRRAAGAVAVGLVGLPDAALGERADDRARALAGLLVRAIEQERALLGVDDRGERDQPDRRDGEHGGDEPRAQRAHHARGVRRA